MAFLTKQIRPGMKIKQSVTYLTVLLATLLLSGSPDTLEANDKSIKIGITPVFLTDRTAFLEEWRSYLAKSIGVPVKFEQRKSYREVTELLLSGELDVAWLCGYPFVQHMDQLKLLGAPVYKGKPLYQSYLIVPSDDAHTQTIADLKGKVFAFSDPNSNSGYLSPQVELLRAGVNPGQFFKKTFFTWSHRNVVEAVAEGLAQGGAVDGYVWDTLLMLDPKLTTRTRVVSRSDFFGFPPLVTLKGIDVQLEKKLQVAFGEMDKTTEGKALLEKLNLDGFVPVDNEIYHDIKAMAELLK